jgi:GxxExxY protein
MDENAIAHHIIGAAISVHKEVGPGLLESAYQRALMYEMRLRGLNFDAEVPLVFQYKDYLIDDAYRLDLLVEGKIIVELKATDSKTNLHKAQLLTYLRLSKKKLGLLINFNEMKLKDGLVRVVNNL